VEATELKSRFKNFPCARKYFGVNANLTTVIVSRARWKHQIITNSWKVEPTLKDKVSGLETGQEWSRTHQPVAAWKFFIKVSGS